MKTFALAVCALVLLGCGPSEQQQAREAAAQQAAHDLAKHNNERRDTCLREKQARIDAAAAMSKQRKWTDAVEQVADCAYDTKDVDFLKALADANRGKYLAVANDPKARAADKAYAYRVLARDYPDLAPKYGALIDKADLDAKRAAEAADRAARKKQGVIIGMTQDEVLMSSWGKPRRVNRTTYSFGVHEQWVYDGGYLYFENGKLKTIQN
jgi:hypothetical protein